MALDGLFGTSLDDPRTLGLLNIAASLSSNRNPIAGLSQGLLGRQQIIQQAQESANQQKLKGLQLQQAQEQMAAQQRQRDFLANLQSPEQAASQAALAGGGGPTTANAANIQPVDPQQSQLFKAMQAGVIPYTDYLNATRKNDAPGKLASGEILYDPKTLKPLLTNPKEDSTPSAVKEYNFAVAQGYPGSFQQFQLEQKRAGATNVSVSTDKGFGEAFAKGAASYLSDSRDKANAAARTLTTLNRADEALNSGKVIVGPASGARTAIAQVGQLIGVGGKDNEEKLQNTRQLLQASASLAVDGAQALAGQGQITDKERDLVNRMAGGDLDRMTVPEIKTAVRIARQINSQTIQSHNQQLRNIDPKFAPYAPFYQVNAPQAPAPATGGFPGVDPSAIEAELRRRMGGQ